MAEGEAATTDGSNLLRPAPGTACSWGDFATDRPRDRYAGEIRRACESGDISRVRALFAEAREAGALQGLLPCEVEIRLGQLLGPRYLGGAGLLALAAELGRTAQYVAKVLRLAGVPIRPAFRPASVPPVDLAELRRRYENGSSISSLARLIHYSRDRTRRFLLIGGTELRPRDPRFAVSPNSAPSRMSGR